jgi:outer membrane protein assembly factor BamD (BamD/ComL family)
MWICGLLLVPVPGCSSFETSKAKDPFAEPDAKNEGAALDQFDKTIRKLTGRGPDRDKAYRLLGEGKSRYSQGVQERAAKDEAALATFTEAAETLTEAAARWPDSALEEEAQYLSGECYFFADNYPDAEDAYGTLLKKYPRSQYLDLVQARRFSIAQYWLDQYNHQDPSTFTVNVTDETQPWRDSFGHAMRIFDRIRLDDPTGKLADDATLALGNAHFAAGKFIKADEYYTDLRKTFPSSEHQFRAHFLGLKAKLESYQGAEYSGNVLEESDKLLRQILRQFPVESEKEKEYLARAGAKIRFLLAEREWSRGSFHERRAEYGAARMYYGTLTKEYADTPFAQNASERLRQIQGEPDVPPQRMEWLVDMFPEREAVHPLIATGNGTSNSTQRR